MAQFVYRGHLPAKSADGSVVVRFGEIVDENHVAIKEAWAKFYPVNAGVEEAPETVEEATIVASDENEGFEPEDIQTF